MSKRQYKNSASAARVIGGSNATFGFGGITGFAASTSTLSYLNELPDLSSISDSNTVVAFKNLTKRDATTKTKALEDLYSLLSSNASEIEDGVLDAWTSIYPRTSIDTARRVRQLAHTIQGSITAKSGKKMAKRIPGVIGAWLAGQYDSDKGVSRAASDSLAQAFPAHEKRQVLWRAYQLQILEFCRDVLENESPQTLSDERNVSPDEANAKYFRVVTSAIGLLSASTSQSAEEDFGKKESQYKDVLENKKLWEKATAEDVGVRRAIHKMLRNMLSLDATRACLNFQLLSKAYISKGLDSDQSGSASEFVDTLVVLTNTNKALWTELWQDKKPPSSRLKSFLKRGSQGSAVSYWSGIAKLFDELPRESLPSHQENAEELLSAFRTGVTRKDEPRSYAVEGMKAYVHAVQVLLQAVSETERSTLVKATLLSLVEHFMYPKAGKYTWSIPATGAYTVISEIAKDDVLASSIVEELEAITIDLLRQIKLALPEQANDYKKSQEELGQAGERFATLISILTKSQPELTSSKPLQNSLAEVVRASLSTLVNRNGKPYGAAIVFADIIKKCRVVIDQAEAITSMIEVFLESAVSQIFVSPSCKQLADVLRQCEDQEELFVPAWDKCINAVFSDESALKYPALVELLTCRAKISDADLAHLSPEIEPLILAKIDAIWTSDGSWEPVLHLFGKSAIVSQLFNNALFDRVNKALSSMQETLILKGIEGLRRILQTIPSLLKNYLASENGKRLLPNLLLLSESSDETIIQATVELIPLVQALLGSSNSSNESGNAIVDVIQNGLNKAELSSVSIDTLANHAKSLIDHKVVTTIELLLPAETRWNESLAPFADLAIDKSRSLTSELGGVVYLVANPESKTSNPIDRDADGFSIPLRMMAYTIKLIQVVPEVSKCLSQQLSRLLARTTLLANDNLSIYDQSTSLWTNPDPAIVNEISDLVALGMVITQERTSLMFDSPDFEVLDRSPDSYYTALLRAKVGGATEHSKSDVVNLETQFKESILRNDVFSAVAQLYVFQDELLSSNVVVRECNVLISDLTTLAAERLRDEGLPKLILLNAILKHHADARDTIAKPRLSRFVSKSVAWLSDETVEDEAVSEIYRALAQLLPEMSDMYGDYWKTMLDSIKSSVELVSELPDANAPALVPLVYTAIQLYGEIRRIKSSEASKPDDEKNEDVLEAWTVSEDGMIVALIAAIQIPRLVSDEKHTPLMILNLLLSREVSRVPTSKLDGVEALYGQLYSPSPAIQQAAYRILHRYIPSRQEQISIDTALDRTSARLPDELLSLILEVPIVASFSEEDFERAVPLQLRGYLLSWLLVFDHFTNATHKLRNDYAVSMKESGHLADLLEFSFEFLGHGRAKPVDVSKFDIGSYNTSTMEDQPLKDTQWLLSHLYYLTLTHFPALAKAWWFDCKSRGKSIAIEEWTGKYISPLVISTALEAALVWSATQEQAHTSEEPPPLVIKINHRTQELIASYPMDVDEGQNALITISLPESFPLHNAKVTSPTKAMAVDERQWSTWLRNSQAIIAFSNNSIVDGLLAWRRNVFGALKGQTECAICYSVVGEDGKIPTRKCKTCKNSFHSGCLFKWFKSSNGSTCPLCRQPYSYA